MEQNNLYPIFLKVHDLSVLIVGAGYVALEKLTFLFKSSPNANVTLVAPEVRKEIRQMAVKSSLRIIQEEYSTQHLEGKHMVIGATNFPEINQKIYKDCRQRNLLVNIADCPEYCDFYLGGIVTKGNLKIAISTNGKSPTTAKRFRQFFEEVIPEDINLFLENINSYRSHIKGDFEEKIKTLNSLTESLIKTDK